MEKTTIEVQGKERDKKTGKIIKQKPAFKQKKQHGQVYEISNAAEIRKERASQLIKALAVLRGGSKQAAFATDVSPKVLILAGLTCGNPIFNTIFEDKSNSNDRGKTVILNVEALKEIAIDYKDRICTPIFIGIRTGFIQNEDDVRKLESVSVTELGGNNIKFVVTTPIDAARKMSQALDDMNSSEQSNDGQGKNIEAAS